MNLDHTEKEQKKLKHSIKHGECIKTPAYHWLYFRNVPFVAWVFLKKKKTI